MILFPCLMVLLGLCCVSRAPKNPGKVEDAPSGNTTVVSAVNATHSATNWTTKNDFYSASNNISSQNKSAETIEVRNMPVEEGDIMMTEDRNAANTLWSNAIVPYEINPELDHRRAEILAAFRMISASTCIRFVARTNELNYLHIRDGEGCASFVGVSGGSQTVYFGPSCAVGNLVHELIHALGLYHEHTRGDRDQFITINWPSVIPDKKENFKVKYGNTLNLPYDFESIMHYGTTYFSVDGSPTILVNDNKDVGQRTHLSALDIRKLKALYRC
ncbi:high choriolytic enzyme 1-like isoform X2 [Fundulus heteroclitus]|uniref:high choriolytic enzyme 1-like isoform X2 n=1 Tax=Fundulus heteroclitus TaxID=8078 RepID=UPI00165A59F6|nr:high choriolytic enzyme 1-like isoform X2 [Fundulus heteroclitus]